MSKKKEKIIGLKESLTLAGAGVGMGILGEAFESEGLKQAGTATVSYVPVMVNVGMGLTTINMLKKLRRNKHG